jgi:hypothetical protein
VIFIDSDDSPEQQTFTLAHEVGHFLRHCWEPRRKLAASIGPRIDEVLDGQRTSTSGERLAALIQGLDLRPMGHLLERDPWGRPSREILLAESEADRLAFELLAPHQEVVTRLGPATQNREAIAALLVSNFRLPLEQSRGYTRILSESMAQHEPWLLRLLDYDNSVE